MWVLPKVPPVKVTREVAVYLGPVELSLFRGIGGALFVLERMPLFIRHILCGLFDCLRINKFLSALCAAKRIKADF